MKSTRLTLPLALAAIVAGGACANPARPNIVMLFADDLGRYARAYADPARPSPNDIMTTPAFDRVAREGARFDHAFVSSPSCTPSRAALATGRHFFRNGSNAQLHMPWSGDEPDPFEPVRGVAQILREAGYHIGHTGKVHMRMSLIGGAGCLYGRAGNRMNRYSQIVSAAADPAAAAADILEEVRTNFRSFLAAREPGQPFYYSLHPTNTHRKWIKGSGLALWGINPDDLKGRLPPWLPDVHEIREDFADYLGEAMAFDAYCGVILEELERLGELDSTVVAISGDHGAPGFPLGKANVGDFGARVLLAIRWPARIAPGRVVSSPVSLIDLAPTFLAAAGLDREPGMDGQNLLPAIERDGTDDRLRGWALIGREVHAHASRNGRLPYPIRALRTADHLYIINFHPERWPAGEPRAALDDPPAPATEWENITGIGFGDIDASPTKAWFVAHRHLPIAADAWARGFERRAGEELYDLRSDPEQMTNLAGDSRHDATRLAMRERLLELLKHGGDPRLDDAFDRPPHLAPKTDGRAAASAGRRRDGPPDSTTEDARHESPTISDPLGRRGRRRRLRSFRSARRHHRFLPWPPIHACFRIRAARARRHAKRAEKTAPAATASRTRITASVGHSVTGQPTGSGPEISTAPAVSPIPSAAAFMRAFRATEECPSRRDIWRSSGAPP